MEGEVRELVLGLALLGQRRLEPVDLEPLRRLDLALVALLEEEREPERHLDLAQRLQLVDRLARELQLGEPHARVDQYSLLAREELELRRGEHHGRFRGLHDG